MASRTDEIVTPETAIRLYLTYLKDPSSLVDAVEVKKLEGKLARAKDPLVRLRAIAALNHASAADPTTLIEDFVTHAKRWAQDQGVPEAAFREMGVPNKVLRAAGFGSTKVLRGNKAKGTARRSRTTPDQLTSGVLALTSDFTIKEIMELVGGSQITVRNVIRVLEAQGKIVFAGERTSGRGRAARSWKAA